jgi:hypothetical protein
MKCASASSQYTEAFDGTVPKIYEYAVPGTPGHGPLFPGTPDSKKSALIQMPDWTAASLIQLFAETEILEQTGRDLVVHITSEKIFVADELPVTFYYRKNGKFIASKVEINGQPGYYNYCWRE